MAKKYYWLRLKRDFFKRHDIKIIESMENGKDYILFYLKLLCESVDHDGKLRFSDQIPYNEQMLATITNTNVDVVRSAIKVFSELGMMEMLDDGTFYMNEVEKLIGSETEWAEKKRIWREKQALLEDKSRTKKDNVRQEKEKEIEKDINNMSQTRRNLYEIFEKLYKAYPKKKSGKAKAKDKFVKWCTTGVVVNGKNVVLTPEQIAGAMNNYSKDKDFEDPTYWKNIDTLMNQIYDYVGEDDEGK